MKDSASKDRSFVVAEANTGKNRTDNTVSNNNKQIGAFLNDFQPISTTVGTSLSKI